MRPQGVRAIVSAPLLEDGALVAVLSAVSADAAGLDRRGGRPGAERCRHCLAGAGEGACGPPRDDERRAPAARAGRGADRHVGLGPETRHAYFSPECKDILGLDGPKARLPDEWQRNVDPQQLSLVCAMLEECVACGEAKSSTATGIPRAACGGSITRPVSWSTPGIGTSSASVSM